MPVVVLESGSLVLRPMQWGLIPTWAKDVSRTYPMINARAEAIEEKPSFKNLLKSCRCAVLVSGYYVRKEAEKSKQVMKVERADGSPMILAGLWADNPVFETMTYSIITTKATEQLATNHDRQPMIIEKDDLDLWFTGSWREAKKLINPYDRALTTSAISD